MTFFQIIQTLADKSEQVVFESGNLQKVTNQLNTLKAEFPDQSYFIRQRYA